MSSDIRPITITSRHISIITPRVSEGVLRALAARKPVKNSIIQKVLAIIALLCIGFSHALALDIDRLIEGSDDVDIYRRQFVAATGRLIAEGTCTGADFMEMGGWSRSVSDKGEKLFFIYCGGITAAHRVYLDPISGETFK